MVAPYGEARRLRYIFLSCSELNGESVEITNFIEKILNKSNNINEYLGSYVRSTGILRTPAVCRNYLRFTEWLGLLKIDSKFVIPTGYTIFFGHIAKNQNFYLSTQEKISFFCHIFPFESKGGKAIYTTKKHYGEITLSEIIKFLLKNIENKLTPNKFLKLAEVNNLPLDEHIIETILEWFVDLDLLVHKKQKGGYYNPTAFGIMISRYLKNNCNDDIICKHIFSKLLNKNIKTIEKIKLPTICKRLENIIINEEIAELVKSRLDPRQYSALPIVLYLQLKLLTEDMVYISFKKLIQTLEDINKKDYICTNITFEWDYLAEEGFIRITV